MCILPMLERGEGVQEVIAAMSLYVYITNSLFHMYTVGNDLIVVF